MEIVEIVYVTKLDPKCWVHHCVLGFNLGIIHEKEGYKDSKLVAAFQHLQAW